MLLSAESTYPIIQLPESVVVVQEVSVDTVTVVRVIEELNEPKVYAEYLVANDPYPKTCVVLDGSNYFPEWDDATVSEAIYLHLTSQG